jgi:hypothetical protein
MKVAFVSACNGCKLKSEYESRKSANRLPRCVIARRHSCRQCAATGTVAPPLLDGRKSVASTTLTNMCASIGVSGIPRPANRLPLCVIARRHSRSLCVPTAHARLPGHSDLHQQVPGGKQQRRLRRLRRLRRVSTRRFAAAPRIHRRRRLHV